MCCIIAQHTTLSIQYLLVGIMVNVQNDISELHIVVFVVARLIFLDSVTH
jgi:hypothetical protein